MRRALFTVAAVVSLVGLLASGADAGRVLASVLRLLGHLA